MSASDASASALDAGVSADGAVSKGRADGGGADATPLQPGAKRVFITQETFRGDLISGSGSASGGADRGDGLCTNAAKLAQLGGAWKAWLSTSTVDAIDRIADVGPWYDLGGTLIFSDTAGLASSPEAALWLDENGSSLASDRIWTGTGLGGTYSPDLGPGSKPCGDWSAATMGETAKIGQVGRKDGAAWTAYAGTTCDQKAHLICFEQ